MKHSPCSVLFLQLLRIYCPFNYLICKQNVIAVSNPVHVEQIAKFSSKIMVNWYMIRAFDPECGFLS